MTIGFGHAQEGAVDESEDAAVVGPFDANLLPHRQGVPLEASPFTGIGQHHGLARHGEQVPPRVHQPLDAGVHPLGHLIARPTPLMDHLTFHGEWMGQAAQRHGEDEVPRLL